MTEPRAKEPWDYLEGEPALDAPVSDNPSGLYCPDCRSTGVKHCASPEYCGGMRKMRAAPTPSEPPRSAEGTRIHDGEVAFLAGCPRGLIDCAAISRTASPNYASYMCCGETDASAVPTDVLRLCIKSSHDRKPVDILVNLDRRDAIDTAAVLLAGMSSLAQADAANAFAIPEATNG